MQIIRMRMWLKIRLDELRPKGKSQAGLARALEIAPPRISEMITGTRVIRSEEVQILADYLEWPVERVLNLLHRAGEDAVNPSETIEPQAGGEPQGGHQPEGTMDDTEFDKARIKRIAGRYDLDLAAVLLDEVLEELRSERRRAARPPLKRA